MPTASGLPDGELAFTTSHYGKTSRNTLTFQFTPRLTGSFRYSILKDYFSPSTGGDLFDRSFDVQYRFIDEGRIRPAIAVGLRDFGGTGIFGAEYIVATKRIKPNLSVTGGIGWGRLGSYNGFSNPLGIFGDSFTTRPGFSGLSEVGRISADRFFRGDAALFAGIEWAYSDQLTFKAEYSSDAYVQESIRMGFEHRSPFNFGLNYRFKNGANLGVYYLYGSEIGATFSYTLNPKHPRVTGGIEEAPPPILPRYAAAAKTWNIEPATRSNPNHDLRDALTGALKQQGIKLVALDIRPASVTVHVENVRYDASAQAIGRTSRVLANTLPVSIETFNIIPVLHGMPLSKVVLERTDLEELETDLDGSWQSYVRAKITDGRDNKIQTENMVTSKFSDFGYQFSGYFSPALFDPDQPIRADIGVELSASYEPRPGLVFSGSLRQPLLGNLNTATRVSNSVLPHVRSDAVLYDTQSDLELSYLTAEYFYRPGKNLYGRVTAGYLERMYGGISAEVLWKPVTGPFALGAELNYAVKRDFDLGLGFQNYDVLTGHASAYYDFGNGYLGQIDAGRYLAGDWGTTISLDREFANGWKVGAFFTLTNVSFDDFGEGAFDKGIRIQIPLSWLSGEPSRRGFGTTIRPVTRDGGARLNVRNRLYDITRGYHDPKLKERWGRFWR